MISVRMYRQLLRLYPAPHRHQFGEEMVAVFREIRSEATSSGIVARSVFYLREAVGVITGAVQEHWLALGGHDVAIWVPTRRLTVHTEFRFPKATAILMTIILAGVMLAIKKGEAISASLPYSNPPVGPIQPTHSVLVGGILLTFAFFYAAGMIGWAILFAMRRSGVHRLDETAEPK